MMRIYLVVVDESPEAEIALRFAARRAVKTGGGVEILTLLPPQEFIAFGGVQATIEEEALQHAEGLVAAAAGTLGRPMAKRAQVTCNAAATSGNSARVASLPGRISNTSSASSSSRSAGISLSAASNGR